MKFSTKGFIFLAIIALSYGVFVEGAGTFLRGDTQTFQGLGILDNVRNITLHDNFLIISDVDNGALVAIFNAPLNFTPIVVQSMPGGGVAFPNTSISFLGDVNNFDNINAFSRFSENNINNGTNASAGFIGINNAGHSISMGVASEAFEFLGTPFPNIGVLRLGSPAEMIFLNDYIRGWVFISDLNDSGGFQEAFTAMDLDHNGNLTISGNLTLNNSIAFEQVDSSDNITGFVKMFCKNTNQCFITRDDGTERRLLDGGGGSIIIDDVWDYVVEPVFEAGINISNSSNITLDGGDIRGVGNLYLTGSVTMGASLGYTGSCINTVYAGGLAVACND